MKTREQKISRFGRVAVLMGGCSAEREVSLASGEAVLKGLRASGVNAEAVDVGALGHVADQLQGFDSAFITLHGRGGEDGEVQKILERLNMPYTGSGVNASAVAMNKAKTKEVWIKAGLPTPAFFRVTGKGELPVAIKAVPSPYIVKPANEGSSIGMSRASTPDDVRTAILKAQAYDAEVLVEQWVDGEEYTVSIVNGRALPAIRLQTPRDFYDYTAKYSATDTEYICPCGLDIHEEDSLAALCKTAFDAIGCSGWGRVDVIRDTAGRFQLLEVNTVPGMTDHSLLPMAANAAGVGFDGLVLEIMETASTKEMVSSV